MEKTSYTPCFLPRDVERADGDSLLSNFWKSQSVSPQEGSLRRETEQEMKQLPLPAKVTKASLSSPSYPFSPPQLALLQTWRHHTISSPPGISTNRGYTAQPFFALHSPGAYPAHSVSLTVVPHCCPWATLDLCIGCGFALHTSSLCHWFLFMSI